ncbi:MAG: cytochrome c oxidase accessory protein CcoG [Limisphaerales bacterium]
MNAPAPVSTDFREKPDWKDFRDHLSTADEQGRRRWVYARQPQGRFYQWRTNLSWLLLGILFAVPFIQINGNPMLMLNVVTRRFSILGRIFWPQDMVLLAIALLLYFIGIMVFTAAYGRLWCGWICPQTLFMEMVFRRIEYKIEGDSRAQRALAAAPWTARKIRLKLAKHAIFFGLSFVISNLLLSYIIGIDQLLAIVTDNPLRHLSGLAYLLAFTGVFYAIFARFREQACTFICPYGRFQSTVLDENTVVVAYDHKRGEQRATLDRRQSPAQRQQAGRGDCVDCHLCVSVCPTGIDIRDGIQMECVHCTACIDACDGVMTKLGRPRGLIRYASLNSIERGEGFRVTPRMIGYAAILSVLAGLFLFLVLTRPNVEATLLRAPGALFQQLPNGNLVNLYTLQLVNKTSQPMPVQLQLEDVPGKLSIMGDPNLVVPKEQLASAPVLIELAPDLLRNGPKKFHVGVYSQGRRVQIVPTTFIGPRN